MICRSCGFVIKDRAKTCPYCNLKNPDLYRGLKDGEAPPRSHSSQSPARPGVPSYTQPVPKQSEQGVPKFLEQIYTMWADLTNEWPSGAPSQPQGQSPRTTSRNVPAIVGTVVTVIFGILVLIGMLHSIFEGAV